MGSRMIGNKIHSGSNWHRMGPLKMTDISISILENYSKPQEQPMFKKGMSQMTSLVPIYGSRQRVKVGQRMDWASYDWVPMRQKELISWEMGWQKPLEKGGSWTFGYATFSFFCRWCHGRMAGFWGLWMHIIFYSSISSWLWLKK